MKVTELESQGLKRAYKIVVDATLIQQQMEVELKAAGERVKIPGFRPGYIPMKVLQQRYGKAVQSDVLKQVINRSSNELLTEKKLRPAMMPQINIDDYKEGEQLTYTMSLDVFPPVPDMSFDKIMLERSTFDIEEKDIDAAVQRVAERSPRLEPAKEGGKAAMGQIVAINFRGMIDGQPFDGGSADNFRLELGSKQFIDNFEEQLVGCKAGDEKTVAVTFPKDYHSEMLAGKEANFAVTVNSIYDRVVPTIDEEFAKSCGFADVRALREGVRNQMIKEYEQVVRRKLKKQLFDYLDDTYDFELPERMVEIEFNTIWERLQQAKQEGDTSTEGKNEEELKEEYRSIARRRVKLGIMLSEIGNRHTIQVTREEMSRAVMQQASMFPGQEKKVMEFYRDHPERVEDLRGPILEEKSVDFILGKVAFSDKKTTVEALLAEEEDDAEESAKAKSGAKAKSAKSKAGAKKKTSAE